MLMENDFFLIMFAKLLLLAKLLECLMRLLLTESLKSSQIYILSGNIYALKLR